MLPALRNLPIDGQCAAQAQKLPINEQSRNQHLHVAPHSRGACMGCMVHTRSCRHGSLIRALLAGIPSGSGGGGRRLHL